MPGSPADVGAVDVPKNTAQGLPAQGLKDVHSVVINRPNRNDKRTQLTVLRFFVTGLQPDQLFCLSSRYSL